MIIVAATFWWEVQALLWKFLPKDGQVNMTLYIFGLVLALSLVAFVIGRRAKRSWLTRFALTSAALVMAAWTALYLTRPAWLRIALQPAVPAPHIVGLRWETRAPGLETAEVELMAEGARVDRMVLVRLDPRHQRLSVRWDPTASRTAEDWQRETQASVVVMGSYFSHGYTPLTPLRLAGRPAGPTDYDSIHGAFVVSGERAEIIDLRGRNVAAAINPYPEAIVSYPLLIDPAGENRAAESKGWLASRSFVALDEAGRVVLGTTETGFLTIRRLGEFLKSSPLGLRLALNLDGGPGVCQIVRAGGFARNFPGTAEMSDGADVLRAFWHRHLGINWTLPIVLVATPVTP